MSEEQSNENGSKEKGSKARDLMARVTDRIAGSADTVCDRLVDAMVEKELSSRVSTLDKAFLMWKDQTKELQKLSKPDNVVYDIDGKQVGEGSFSKDRAGQVKKAREKLQKLEGAMEKALAGDFQKLRELCK